MLFFAPPSTSAGCGHGGAQGILPPCGGGCLKLVVPTVPFRGGLSLSPIPREDKIMLQVGFLFIYLFIF